jgi:hypothetical protein
LTVIGSYGRQAQEEIHLGELCWLKVNSHGERLPLGDVAW